MTAYELFILIQLMVSVCTVQHTRSQGSCDNDFDMFSEDGSITDSGRGGSEQGEHLNPAGSTRPFPDNSFSAPSSSSPSPPVVQQQDPSLSDNVTGSRSPTQPSPAEHQPLETHSTRN
jgi:hypothetical protein